MAFSPIAFVAPNYRDYKEYWLKAYIPDTTTPKAMALDSETSILVAKAQLNKDGFIVSDGGALVIPYIEGVYDLWLFPTATDADNNNTASAIRVAENMTAIGSDGLITVIDDDEQELSSGQLVVDFDTVVLSTSSIYVDNGSGDRGKLFLGGDYFLSGDSQITLTSSFAAGTKIITESTRSVDIQSIAKTIKDYGATGDGIEDDTQAYNLAVEDINAGRIGLLIFPEGTYLINPFETLVINDKSAVIQGAGRGVSTIKTHIADGVLIDYIRSTDSKTLSISNISMICGFGTSSTAMRASDTRVGVNGGIDCLVLTNVEVETEQGVWWQRQIKMRETGGLVINYAYLRNGGQSDAQNDPLTAIVEIENLNTGVFIIRGIDCSQVYMQRANTMVLLTADKSIESVYLNSGELVGADYGVKTDGAGKVGAVKLDVHMDCIINNVLANTNFNFAKIEGDLRLSSNGAPLEVNGTNCVFNGNVEMMQATGSVSLEAGAVGGTAYEFNGNLIQSKIEPQIRSDASGIRMTGVGITFGNTLAPSFSSGIINKFIDVPDSMYNETNQLENDTFAGDLDLLFSKVTDEYFRTVTYRLTSGATNLPAGVVAGGSIVITMGFDSNAGHQVLYPSNSGLLFSYVRTFSSGVVSAWGRQGAPLSGVYASPTSITIENGIVTAIS